MKTNRLKTWVGGAWEYVQFELGEYTDSGWEELWKRGVLSFFKKSQIDSSEGGELCISSEE